MKNNAQNALDAGAIYPVSYTHLALSLASCGKSDTNADTNGGASTTVAEAQQGSSTSEQNESKPVSLGDFSAQDFDGNAVSKDIFADYDLTMVNLWTTTCSYCIEEMPILNELRKEFQDDGVRFNIISVCMDVGLSLIHILSYFCFICVDCYWNRRKPHE